MNGRRAILVVVLAAIGVSAGVAHAAPQLDPATEQANFSKTQERAAIYNTPSYQARLRIEGQKSQTAALLAVAADPERQFMSDLCWNLTDGCAGDVRLYDWGTNGYGMVEPVLFTARNGATISGHVWATRSGPASRPGVVITNGSVQADEQMYWYAAQTLAKAGYVVLTWDPQGQGQSDTFGEGADRMEGVPAQSDGRPFFDGTEDALNFFFSTAGKPYEPIPSCETGTNHAPKQNRRAAAGLDAGYNPFAGLFDGKTVGLAGHSYGAAGVSYIGQWDKRVDAVVAWDNLSQDSAGTNEAGSFPPGEAGCPADPSQRSKPDRTAKTAAPALGMSADYFLPPTPNTSYPDQSQCPAAQSAVEKGGAPSMSAGTNCKSLASKIYSKRGIDSGEIVIRGGSHLDFSFIPNPAFGASLRGADEISWYTTAWFDKYLKRNPKADARLLTNRWLDDDAEAAVDPGGSGNMFSFYHPSRIEIHLFKRQGQVNRGKRLVRRGQKLKHRGKKKLGAHYIKRGRHFIKRGSKPLRCEDMRAGCRGNLRADDYPGEYDYLKIATSEDTDQPGTLGAPIRSNKH